MLLVDDDPDVVESVGALAATLLPGVRVRTATSGPDALAILSRERVDLLIVDYRMPGMDGLQVLRRVESLRPQPIRIMLTAYPDAELASRAAVEGHAALVISKPFDPAYFLEVVGGLLSRHPPAD